MVNLNNIVVVIVVQQVVQVVGCQVVLNFLQDVLDGLGEGGFKVDVLLLFEQVWQNVKGLVQIQVGGKIMVSIEQIVDKVVFNWEIFNVGCNIIVDFQQYVDWVLFNWVNDFSVWFSQIQGQIKVDGMVMLVNCNGVVFFGSSQVDVCNLMVVVVNILDEQFCQCGFYYDNVGSCLIFIDVVGVVCVEWGVQLCMVVLFGLIKGGGYVLLFGSEVDNVGSIVMLKGQMVLFVGDSFVICCGQGIDGNLIFIICGNEVLLGFVVDSSVGWVCNSGLVQVVIGDISFSGCEVEQVGVLFFSSLVDSCGILYLKVSEWIILVEGVISVILVDSSGSVVFDSQCEVLFKLLNGFSVVVSWGDDDCCDLLWVEIDFVGSVDFCDGFIIFVSGGQVVVNVGQCVLLCDGVVIDVFGV